MFISLLGANISQNYLGEPEGASLRAGFWPSGLPSLVKSVGQLTLNW